MQCVNVSVLSEVKRMKNKERRNKEYRREKFFHKPKSLLNSDTNNRNPNAHNFSKQNK